MRTPLKSRPKRGSKKERVAESRGWPGESRTSWTMAGASPVEGAAGLTDLGLSFFSASSQWEHLRARAGGAGGGGGGGGGGYCLPVQGVGGASLWVRWCDGSCTRASVLRSCAVG